MIQTRGAVAGGRRDESGDMKCPAQPKEGWSSFTFGVRLGRASLQLALKIGHPKLGAAVVIFNYHGSPECFVCLLTRR